MNTPALYEVDPDTNEAVGTVHPFCSATCVEGFDGRTSYIGVRLDLGITDTDDFGFTPKCETCGQFITTSTTPEHFDDAKALLWHLHGEHTSYPDETGAPLDIESLRAIHAVQSEHTGVIE